MEESAVPITSASVAGRVQPLRRNPGGIDDTVTSRLSILPPAPSKAERRASESISYTSGAAILNFVSSSKRNIRHADKNSLQKNLKSLT